jgi:hypothetical protein
MMKSKAVREPIGTWWKIERYAVKIKPVRVVAFSAAFVTYINDGSSWGGGICERRERRDDIFPTFEEARTEAVARATRKVENTRQELQRLRSELGQWASMKEPSA